jgi:hypothetical protein
MQVLAAPGGAGGFRRRAPVWIDETKHRTHLLESLIAWFLANGGQFVEREPNHIRLSTLEVRLWRIFREGIRRTRRPALWFGQPC